MEFTLDERGLVVSIISDKVLFDLGSAELRPAGLVVLDAIGPTLSTLPNAVSVEGHTDDLPISGRYASNWELSTDRAISVLRYLLATAGLPAQRASASGFADQRPKTSNATVDGRAVNRRVEVVVLAQVSGALVVAQPASATTVPAEPTTALSQERNGHG